MKSLRESILGVAGIRKLTPEKIAIIVQAILKDFVTSYSLIRPMKVSVNMYDRNYSNIQIYPKLDFEQYKKLLTDGMEEYIQKITKLSNKIELTQKKRHGSVWWILDFKDENFEYYRDGYNDFKTCNIGINLSDNGVGNCRYMISILLPTEITDYINI